MAAKAEAAIAYEPDGAPDARPRRRDAALGGAGRAPTTPRYRAQIGYLFERSPFYRAKLAAAGFADAASVGGLDAIAALPLTEKDELRASRSAAHPIGAHLAAPMAEVVRIYSTSGTTGTPSYIPLTRGRSRRLDRDLQPLLRRLGGRGRRAHRLDLRRRAVRRRRGARRLRGARALPHPGRPGQHRAAAGGGRRAGARRDRADAVLCAAPGRDRRGARHRPRRRSSVAPAAGRGRARRRRAGAARRGCEAAWGATVTEAMGIGDIAVSLWGECEAQAGMHFSGARLRPRRADRSRDRRRRAPFDGRRRGRARLYPPAAPGRAAAALPQPRPRPGARRRLRLRPHRAAGALHRPHRRHADRARRQPVPDRGARGGGRLRAGGQRRHRHPAAPARRQAGAAAAGGGRAGRGPARRRPELAEAIRGRLRDALVVATEIELVPWASLPRSDYKSKLVDWSRAEPEEETHAQTADPGRASHHARRRRPADLDRLLGGGARHALRLRAAEPRPGRARAISTSIPATGG